jgi:hypothetical protein
MNLIRGDTLMKKINFIKQFLMLILVSIIFMIPVFGANIGEYISYNPESGWKSVYMGDSSFYSADDGFQFHKDPTNRRSSFYTAQENQTLKFKFKGTKIRFITLYKLFQVKGTKILIDGVEQNLPDENSIKYHGNSTLFYERTDLDDKVHEVTVTSGKKSEKWSWTLYIEHIHINHGGQLLPYDYVDKTVLDITPEKYTINLNETLTTDLVINNITNIAAEDIYISYDKTKLEYVGMEEIPGIMLIHSHNDSAKGELRLILASQGEANIINTKKILLKLKFKGIATGDGLIDITKAKVTDGISLEKNLKAEACGQATITIVAPKDVNRSGAFTLIDLGIDARHFGKDPKSAELSAYETDIVVNNAIDKDDLLKISQEMLANSSYIVAVD